MLQKAASFEKSFRNFCKEEGIALSDKTRFFLTSSKTKKGSFEIWNEIGQALMKEFEVPE